MAQFVYALAAKWDAKPFTRVSARSAGAQSKTEIFTLEVPDTANADSVIVTAVPVDAVISSIRFGCDDLGTAGTVSLGFYKRNVDGTYTAVSSAAIASNIDVNTAAAMGCSEGSVKTHCSRAVQSLAKALQTRGITL